MRSGRLFTSVAVTAMTALMLLLTSSPAYAYSSAHHGSDYVRTYGTNYILWSRSATWNLMAMGSGQTSTPTAGPIIRGYSMAMAASHPATFTASRTGSTNSGYANVMSPALPGMLHRPG